MQVLQSINLDFGRSTLPITVFAKQYDKESRYVEITPLNCGQSYTIGSGVTARLQLTKADGHTVINDCTIESGKIKAALTAQCLTADGIATAEIGLYKGTALLSSQIFYIDVKKSAYDSEAPASSDEYNSLVEALGKVDTSLEGIDEAIADAEDATSAARAAASGANTAKTNANNAASSANDAATAATNAAKAANDAAAAAEGADKVNISAVQTPTGATITVTDREGVATEVHIDTLTAVNTWEDIKNAVRLGLGEALFPVGYEFTTLDSDTNANIVWVVRGHDHHTAANGKLTYTMTLEAKYVYSTASGSYKNLQFDAPEALYYAADGLTAGTYNFTWNYTSSAIISGTYQFTLTQAVPAGGQIVLGTNSNSTAIVNCKISTYGSVGDTAAIESNIVVTEGNAGTSLGTTGSVNLNHPHRVLWGSNNYAQSAARQWLNSAAAAGAVWSGKSVFDRRPSWHTSYNGFMHGLPADFLAAVQPAVIPCRTNSIYERNSLDGTEFVINQVYNLEDKFFLLSRPEIYGTWDSASYKDGELLEYYDGLTNAERKKFDVAGSVRNAWLRSPNPSHATNERRVHTDGSVDDNIAYYSYGVAPACIIA